MPGAGDMLRPQSAAEVQERLADANAERRRITLRGGGGISPRGRLVTEIGENSLQAGRQQDAGAEQQDGGNDRQDDFHRKAP